MRLTRAQLSWILYDMGSAAFALIVRTVFAPLLFKNSAHGVWEDAEATAWWGYAGSLAGLAAGVLAPYLGTLADAGGGKKRYLGIFLVLGLGATAGFCFTGAGDAYWVLALYFIGLVAFMAGNSFYDSLLLDVAPRGGMHRLSSRAYAWGYIGGVIPFLFCLIVTFAADAAAWTTKLAFVVTAVWWGVLSLPLFRDIREKRRARRRVSPLDGFRKLARTARELGKYRNAVIFLIAYFLYIDGVGTILMMATPLSRDIGISELWLIGTILGLQFLGFPFTLLYGKLSKRYSARRMIYVAIGIYVTITLLVGVMTLVESAEWKLGLFLLVAFLIGTSQGGIQSLSRSLFSGLIPRERAAEFFGFYNIFGKFTTIVGPVLIGVAAAVWNRSEYGIVLLSIPFLLGGWLLSRVRIPGEKNAGRYVEGRRA